MPEPAILQEAVRLLRDGGGSVEIPVQGGSMRPLLVAGDTIVVDPGREILPGRLIAFRREGSLYVHRVLNVRGDSVREMGDATMAGGEVATGDVLGVAVRVRLGDGGTMSLEGPLAGALGFTLAALMRGMVLLPPRARRFPSLLVRCAGVAWRLMARRTALGASAAD